MATLYHQVWIDAPAAKVYEALASTETEDGLVLAHGPGPAHGAVQMKVLDSTPNKRAVVHNPRKETR
jgi:hypothetical protein